ncbi:MAG: DUF2585 family protein [Phycisphaeraceae bacterium]
MNTARPALSNPKINWLAAAASLGVVALATVVLWWMGRIWWCACAGWTPWSFNIWSSHNSQHLVDPYTLSHVLHGLVLYGFLLVITGGHWPGLRLFLAVVIEVAWEVIENTPRVIQAYRESTIALDYNGDSILNSLADIAACMAGYAAAGLLPMWVSAVSFGVVELVMIWWIRDSLLLNVLMLFWPVEAVKQWQMGAMP